MSAALPAREKQLRTDQRRILRAVSTAVVATCALHVTVSTVWLDVGATREGSWRRAAAASLFGPGLCLVAMVWRVALHRLNSPEDMHCDRPDSQMAVMLQDVLQNTLEQGVAASITYFGWAAMMPPATSRILPAAAAFFVLGRVLFHMNYTRPTAGAPGRAAGFAFTFLPTFTMALRVAASETLSLIAAWGQP